MDHFSVSLSLSLVYSSSSLFASLSLLYIHTQSLYTLVRNIIDQKDTTTPRAYIRAIEQLWVSIWDVAYSTADTVILYTHLKHFLYSISFFSSVFSCILLWLLRIKFKKIKFYIIYKRQSILLFEGSGGGRALRARYTCGGDWSPRSIQRDAFNKV